MADDGAAIKCYNPQSDTVSPSVKLLRAQLTVQADSIVLSVSYYSAADPLEAAAVEAGARLELQHTFSAFPPPQVQRTVKQSVDPSELYRVMRLAGSGTTSPGCSLASRQEVGPTVQLYCTLLYSTVLYRCGAVY